MRDSAAAPAYKPMAALLPTRRNVRDYYDEDSGRPRSRYSPSHGRNTRRREWSPVSSRRDSGVRRFLPKSRSTSSSNAGHHSSDVPVTRRRQGTNLDTVLQTRVLSSYPRVSKGPTAQGRTRSAPSVNPGSYLPLETPMPFVLPHLEWTARVNGPAGFTITKLLLDSACPFVLIHADLVDGLGLKRHTLYRPQEMSLAMSAGKPEIFRSTEYCKLVLEDPLLSWRSCVVRALVVPSLCSSMILGLPFLAYNNLVMDYSARTVFDKTCGFDLLNPAVT
ncbi:hypothetical protein F5890DRAFT_1470027 [Lentinula detonsa]|uniref:Uncharacterized protein n=1 Tax=Lentinula detonsa TaxID=2804962 RepID=A0AA38QAF0_9AGAR|nr:hypothetical protein F5890DRAFT_1470027 [Lentinula detonsa]